MFLAHKHAQKGQATKPSKQSIHGIKKYGWVRTKKAEITKKKRGRSRQETVTTERRQ
jgi:hypothetical protein